ncbi:zinc finger protein 43 isoform X2 [Cephus cinctus]|nr:zinc finger protein 43 isoform X2 [Cephus cinctus]
MPETEMTSDQDVETQEIKYLLCRLCGMTTEDPVDIFEESNITETINKLLPTSICQQETLSRYICSPCHKKIIFIQDFVLLCIENEKRLSNLTTLTDQSIEIPVNDNTEVAKILQIHDKTNKYRCPNCKVNLIISKDVQSENFDSAFQITLNSTDSADGSEINAELKKQKTDVVSRKGTHKGISTRSVRNLRSSSNLLKKSNTVSERHTRRQTRNISRPTKSNTTESHAKNIHNSLNKKSSRGKSKTNLRDIRKRIVKSDHDNEKHTQSPKRRKMVSETTENTFLTIDPNLDVSNITSEFVDFDTLEESNDESIKRPMTHKCDICDIEFSSEDYYRFHVDRHEMGCLNDFKCPTCKKELSSEDSLWEHQKCCEIGLEYYSCTLCQKTFLEKELLNDHMQIHDQEDTKSLNTDTDTVQSENGKKSTKLTCEVCGARYVLRERYEFHIERHHFGNIKTFSCLICEKRFKSENILWDHYQYQHRAGEKFACITCEKTFVKRANLNYHLKTFGHKGGKFVNSIEHNQSTDSSNVKLSDVGKPRPKITCLECGARFVLQERYEFHMERHKSGKMDVCVCNLCGRESTNENVLWDHYQYMHKRTKRYVCTTCGKLFHKQSMLSRHQVKYGHKGTKEIDIETDDNAITIDSAAFKKVIAEEIIEIKSVNCVLCGEVVWGVDPNLINDAVTCSNCERPGLSLQVDSDGAKVISRRQYHCNMCNKHFTTKDRLEYHIMRHSENMEEFVCSTCGKELSTEQALFEHYLYVHKGARPHVCELCGKSYQFKARLKEHMRSHSGERPFACEICGQRCMTNNALRSHKKTHITEKRFPCQICKKAFRKRQDLNEHLERHWKNDKTMTLPQVFSCSICMEMFPTFRILKKHMKETHSVESQDPILTELQPWFECEDCHEKFKHQMSLKVHRERVHEGKMKPVYHCDICDITYKNARVLSNHIKNKHEGGKRYKCAQCGKEYNQSTSLHNHILLHTGEKPFSCEHCEMTFRTKESRDHHQRKHTGERPYKCPHCDKAFATTTQRREHRKREHDEGNNHYCPECGKECFGEHGVRSHLNTHMAEKQQSQNDIT